MRKQIVSIFMAAVMAGMQFKPDKLRLGAAGIFRHDWCRSSKL